MDSLLRSGSASKWMGLVAGIWVEAFAGNIYTFAHYSPTFKTLLHYNQLQLQNLAAAKDIGENVGLLPGLLSNHLPPWALLSVGALHTCFGYGVLWLVASQRLAPLSFWQMWVALCVGGSSTNWFNTTVLVTCIRNYSHTRGTVSGFLKGFLGLSGAIFTRIFVDLLSKNPVHLLLFLAIGPAVVSLVSMNFVRPINPPQCAAKDDPEEHRNFLFIHMLCIALALYLFLATVLEYALPLQGEFTSKIIVGVMLLFLLAPVWVPMKLFVESLFDRDSESNISGALNLLIDPIKQPLLDSKETTPNALTFEEEQKCQGKLATETLIVPIHEAEYPLLDAKENLHGTSKLVEEPKIRVQMAAECKEKYQIPITLVQKENVDSFPSHQNNRHSPPPQKEETDAKALVVMVEMRLRKRKGPRRGEDFKLAEAIMKADFWLLFVAFLCGVGTGITAINNLAQIGEAQGYTDVSIFVSLVSVWNFLGRLGGGWVSERFFRSAAMPRPIWMASAQALMVIAHLLFAMAIPGSLHVASAVLGICYGFQFSIMVSTSSELFGLKHFGIIYNFMNMANPVGSLLFSGLLAASIYDSEAEKSSSSGIAPRRGSVMVQKGVDHQCTGAHCFRLTFLIMAGLCVVGVLLSLLLSYRIKAVYKALHGARETLR